MYSRDSLALVLEKVDLLFAEMKHLRGVGPHFRIVHRFRMPGSLCCNGEEIAGAYLIRRGHEYQLPLPASQRILFDFMAKHTRLIQSARQIEMAVRADEFYMRHGENATGRPIVRKMTRSAIKEYMTRLQQALASVFQEARLGIDPAQVLVVRDSGLVLPRLRPGSSW